MEGRKTSHWWTLWGVLILVWAAFPLAWMVSLAFKSPATFRSNEPSFLPKDWTWENFETVFQRRACSPRRCATRPASP